MVRSVLVLVPVLLLGACGGLVDHSPVTSVPVSDSVSTLVSTPEPVKPVGKTCTVPAVVGMVHQAAQDAMQASGLYVLLERDASGQGRLLINDRNWVTTAQVPAAGEVVDCGVEVTLSAKKADE